MRTIALVAAVLVAAGAVRQPRDAPHPNIVLVTLDTTRADRMGFLGSARGLTPSLDALAAESVVFTRAYAQAPTTPVSHATILTGTYPLYHKVTDFGIPLPGGVPYLPDLLRASGYRTAAFVAALVLDPRNGTAPGFDRGFDVYDAGFRIRRPGEDRYETVERRSEAVARRALAWLATGPREPFFLWVHFYDPHDPYDPPSDLKRRFAASPYDGEIASTDRSVGHVVSALRAGGVLDRTAVAVAADHGEGLGDHGEDTHGVFLYEEEVHVPLLIRFPGKRGGGTRVSTRVRLVDLAPTLVEAAGVQSLPAMQGESLRPLMMAPGSPDRPAYAETEYPRRAFGWSPLAAWRADRFLLVRAPRRELYDVVADPAASRNLAGTRSRVADGMDAELATFVRRTAGGDLAPPRVDRALAERLAALGYVAGSDAPPPGRGVDPKDRIAIANALHHAVAAVEDGAFRKAIPLLQQTVASEPTIQIAQLNLGIALAHQRQYAEAIAPLKKAVALQPDAMLGHYELAVALFETGDLDKAAGEFALVVAAMPKWADAHYSLGSVYARINRVPDAVRELTTALDLEPRHDRAHLLIGRIFSLQGRPADAVPHLRAAVDLQPSSAEAHEFLADAYEKAGNVAEAARERRRAQELVVRD